MKKEYFVGYDLAAPLKWWQKILVWIGFRNRWADKSCMVTFRRGGEGHEEVLEVVDVKYL